MEEFRKNIRKILLEELETFDSSLFNFLMRRVKIEEIDLGTDWFDQKQLKMISYKFEGFPDSSFNSFLSKQQATQKILTLLIDNGLIDDSIIFRGNSLDPKHQKIIRTIRKFLEHIEFGKK